jgi:hypothetical protein
MSKICQSCEFFLAGECGHSQQDLLPQPPVNGCRGYLERIPEYKEKESK